jgi:hypothetical protein
VFFVQGGKKRHFASCNVNFWDKLLKAGSLEIMLEAKFLIERCHITCNTIRPHSAMFFLPLAPEASQHDMPDYPRI